MVPKIQIHHWNKSELWDLDHCIYRNFMCDRDEKGKEKSSINGAEKIDSQIRIQKLIVK